MKREKSERFTLFSSDFEHMYLEENGDVFLLNQNVSWVLKIYILKK